MGLMHTSCPWWWLYMEQFRLCPSKKNATKPRHNVQFICTRFLAGGLRKIFRTVRICLFAYKIKKKKQLRFFFKRTFAFSILGHPFQFLVICARSQWIEKCGWKKICASAFKGIRSFHFELCFIYRHISTCAKPKL